MKTTATKRQLPSKCDRLSTLIRHTDAMLTIALTYVQNTMLLKHYSFYLLIVND